MTCWDPLHREYLLKANPWPTTQTCKLFLSAEHSINLPRNMSLDIEQDSLDRWILYRRAQERKAFRQQTPMYKYFQERIQDLEQSRATSDLPTELLDSFAKGEDLFQTRLLKHINKQNVNMIQWSRIVRDRDARLSSLQEEPAHVTCDIVSGITIPNILTSEESKVLSALVEPTPQEAQPKSNITPQSLFTTTSTSEPPAAEDPVDSLGMPDMRDVAQLLVDLKHDPLAIYNATQSNAGTADQSASDIDVSMVAEASFSEQVVENLVGDHLPFYFAEYKRKEKKIKAQTIAQAFMDLIAAVWKLATHDIYECPVFATATDGPTAVVYTAWGMRIPEGQLNPKKGPPVYVYIASQSPPKFDIRKVNQTIQFAMFLLHLRHVHAQRVARRFEAIRIELAEKLKKNDPVLQWTLEQQREEFKQDLETRQNAALDMVRKLREQVLGQQAGSAQQSSGILLGASGQVSSRSQSS
ncbi:hypothetical protein C8Q74DRAFT_283440 [Fomes fomentarius]|nr:hypothetical protein C8Q74DRAFT_283440 [Fomes fomentarius]